MIYRSPNSIGSLFFNCPIIRTATVKPVIRVGENRRTGRITVGPID